MYTSVSALPSCSSRPAPSINPISPLSDRGHGETQNAAILQAQAKEVFRCERRARLLISTATDVGSGADRVY
jgi:hypothetical protein